MNDSPVSSTKARNSHSAKARSRYAPQVRAIGPPSWRRGGYPPCAHTSGPRFGDNERCKESATSLYPTRAPSLQRLLVAPGGLAVLVIVPDHLEAAVAGLVVEPLGGGVVGADLEAKP